MKRLKKEEAIASRNRGESYSEIQKTLKVSKSTLSRWLKDIPLSKELLGKLKEKQRTAYFTSKKKSENRTKYHESIKETASLESKQLINDPFFIAGLMLYWSEGSKNLGSVQFCNSDPQMIKIMIAWFKKYCKVQVDKLKAGLILNSLHCVEECERHWQEITSLPKAQFHKSYVKNSFYKGKKNTLYMGTCKILIHSRDLHSKIMGWKNGVEQTFLEKSAYV